MVSFLLGQQSGYAKFLCFLRYWDNRDKANPWKIKNWPVREQLKVGDKNVIHDQLVLREKMIFAPLHIILRLMKQFFKALDKTGKFFQYILSAFPRLSSEKLKVGIFGGPQIRKLMKHPNFQHSMNEIESASWLSFVEIVKKFLRNCKSDSYKHTLDINIRIKVYFLHNHLDRFPENLSDVSDEQDQRFYQDIKVMEEKHWKKSYGSIGQKHDVRLLLVLETI